MVILVSVNCTTYNHEDYIADAIESFLMQKTSFNFEILIGEDCSTDNTKKIVEGYAEKYPGKVRIITSEKNVGARKNSMRLVENSKGKYIAECEGDDFWTDPNKLQKQIDYMMSNPGCSMSFHASEIIKAPRKQTGAIVRPYHESRVSPIGDIIVRGGGFFSTGSMVYQKKFMENPPEFYLNAPIGDYPMQMILASKGYTYYFNEVMSAYRSGVKGSWTDRMTNSTDVRKNVTSVNEGIIELLDGYNSYTNFEYRSEIDKVKLKLEFELLVLSGDVQKQKISRFNDYSKLDRLKVKAKIFIRCNYPSYFMRLANYKDVKFNFIQQKSSTSNKKEMNVK